MAGVTRRFVFGREEAPGWFDEQVNKGRVKIERDPDTQEVIGATIFAPTKTFEVSIGDVVVISRSGMGIAQNGEEGG